MRIGVTEKVKNFEIDPIFAKKSLSEKTLTPPPLRGTRYLFLYTYILILLNFFHKYYIIISLVNWRYLYLL